VESLATAHDILPIMERYQELDCNSLADKSVSTVYNDVHFYRAQCVQSAVLRLHVVRLSVTLVDHDHIGQKSGKLIARTISPNLRSS